MSDLYGLYCKTCSTGDDWWQHRGYDKAQELYNNFPMHWLVKQVGKKWGNGYFEIDVSDEFDTQETRENYREGYDFTLKHYGHDVCVGIYSTPLDTAEYGYPFKVNHLFREALAAERFDEAITQALIEAGLFENGRYHKAVLMEIKGESNAK